MVKESRVETSRRGTKIWYDADDEIHRDNAPAVMWPGGRAHWYHHGKRHRIDGPAVIHPGGHKEWWIDGVNYNCIEWVLKVYELESK